MGGAISKSWNEMTEVQEAAEEAELKEKEKAGGKVKLRDRIRTRILRADPRSLSEDVSRTPIAVERNQSEGDTPMKTQVQDPRSPGTMGAVDRTPIVVLAPKDGATPLRGAPPPAFELPPTTPQCDTPDPEDLRWPAGMEDDPYPLPRSPLPIKLLLSTSTPTTIPLGGKAAQPSNLLADRLRGEALLALREHNQVGRGRGGR